MELQDAHPASLTHERVSDQPGRAGIPCGRKPLQRPQDVRGMRNRRLLESAYRGYLRSGRARGEDEL